MTQSIQSETLDLLKEHRRDVMAHMEDTRDRLTKIETQLSDLPKRVTALERIKWQLSGALIIISTALSYFFRHAF